MNIERLSKQLKRHEGSNIKNAKHYPYKCPAGKLTVGYGHNVEDNGLSEKIAMELLRDDVTIAEREIKKIVENYDSLSDERQEVLVNMLFNVGLPTLKKFRNMLFAVEKNDFETAAEEMQNSRWYRQVGNRGRELVEQMKSEEIQ